MADAVGRAAFTIAGSFFGPWGALIGGFLGNLLFPVEGPKGPRLSELNIQHSTVGAPIPIVYGTGKLAGNIIWSGGLVEHEQEGGGGKGGPSGPTSYSYSCSFAIGICEGPITGVRRIWFDADLVYDASDDETLEERLGLGGVSFADIAEALLGIRALSAQLDFDLYLGDETQLPDPTIEASEGVGLTPSFRGLAYIVFPDLNLEKYGNRIPNVRLEVTTAGTPTECGIYSAGQLFPWIEGTSDPRNILNNHVFRYASGTLTSSFELAVSEIPTGYLGGSRAAFIPDLVWGWSASSSVINPKVPCSAETSDDHVNLFMFVNSLNVPGEYCGTLPAIAAGSYCLGWDGVFGQGSVRHWGGIADDGQHRTGFSVGTDSSGDETGYFGGQFEPGAFDCGGGRDFETLSDAPVAVQRTIKPPDPCALGTPLAGAPGYCVVGGEIVQGITWTEVSGTFHVLQEYADDGTYVTAYPVNPCLISTDPNYNNQAYWEAAYAQALADGEPIAPGLVYGVDYPDTQSTAYFSECDTLDVACVPMATIVADICRRAGLRTDTSTQIDVSDLTTCVIGYIIGRQMSARDALQPLRMFGLWDAVESDALLKFVERGHAIGATLTDDDLGAHENGSEAPSKVEVSRVQEKELPRRVRLHFPNFKHDHEVSEQYASRITTEAIDEVDIELAISMDPDTAKQLAEISLYEAWVSRNRYRFALDHDWLKLEPTDCIEIPVDGETERVRIVSLTYKIGGLIEIDAVRDDDGAYVSTAVATPGTPSGGVPGSSGGGPICPSDVVLLDIPCLEGTPPEGEAWIYGAVYSLCERFECATLYRSTDGGESFAQVARTDAETTVGEILTITGPATDPTLPGDSPPYDTTNAITVELAAGTLASVTDAQIAAGLNLAAVGIDGRWVLIQFKTATLDTGDQWTLTDLVWGVNDTAHLLGTTVAGDTFVLLSDPALLRIPVPASSIGVEQQWKIVSCGESLDAVTEIEFTGWGLCYRRTCPSTVISASTTTPPSGALDGDAYLLPNDTSLIGDWAGHGGAVAFWSDETESWNYCIPVPGTIIHIIPPGESSSAPGGEDVISGGDGTYTPAPWTPAIPPLLEESGGGVDPATAYTVLYTVDGYRKVLLEDISSGTGTGTGGYPEVLGYSGII